MNYSPKWEYWFGDVINIFQSFVDILSLGLGRRYFLYIIQWLDTRLNNIKCGDEVTRYFKIHLRSYSYLNAQDQLLPRSFCGEKCRNSLS